MTRTRTPRASRDWVAVGFVVVLTALAVGAAAGPVAAQTEGPTVTNVTATASGGNLTVTVAATDVTEVDVTGVPDGWTVVSHRDDFGVYANQLQRDDRLVWLWRVSVSVNVSVTFAATDTSAYNLSVVPYEGTDRGSPVRIVERPPTPTATPTPTPTATSTPPPTTTPTATPTATDGSDAEATTPAATARAEPAAKTPGTTTTDGPGLGVGAALVALALALFAASKRR